MFFKYKKFNKIWFVFLNRILKLNNYFNIGKFFRIMITISFLRRFKDNKLMMNFKIRNYIKQY